MAIFKPPQSGPQGDRAAGPQASGLAVGLAECALSVQMHSVFGATICPRVRERDNLPPHSTAQGSHHGVQPHLGPETFSVGHAQPG